MRLVLAIVSFVLAAVMIGFGIAQRTIFQTPDEAVLSTASTTRAAVTVIDGKALNAFAGSQTLRISGSDTVFAAYGRTSDVLGWIGDTDYTEVAYDAESGELTSTLVQGKATEVPNPTCSDLWLHEYQRDGTLATTVSVPADVSFIVISDGVKPAPADIQISWPLDNSTPWSGPLIVAGAVALLLGLAFLLWATTHMRKSRGPRRKQLKMPKVPKKALYKPSRKPIGKPSGGRRAIGRGMIAVPFVLGGTLLLGACTSPALLEDRVTPSPTASSAPGEEAAPPAVTVPQIERIISEVSKVNTDADAAHDATLLATRFDGPALELRTANYSIVTADPTLPALAAIPDGPVKLTLPQQTDTWPRAVFVVIQDDTDTTVPSLALYLEQADPRANYKVSYAVTLEPSQTIPPVAAAEVGAGRLAADTPLLSLAPADIGPAYADILDKDVDSDSYLDFDQEGDSLRTAVKDYQASVKSSLPATASVTFGTAPGSIDPVVLATNDAGALVAVNIYETTTVAPVEEGAAVNPSGQVKALSGLSISTKGVVATYSDQLLFYVPAAGSDGKVVLLGYSQGLVKAGEVG